MQFDVEAVLRQQPLERCAVAARGGLRREQLGEQQFGRAGQPRVAAAVRGEAADLIADRRRVPGRVAAEPRGHQFRIIGGGHERLVARQQRRPRCPRR